MQIVGGWTVTRGAGQNSTYYGTITDIVLSQKYAIPIGRIVTSHYPREVTDPNLNRIMMGSEGTFGVLTEVTLRVFRWMPENRKRFSYMFKNWEIAMEAAREMMQCECGYSSLFRLSDPEETHLMLKLYNVDDTPSITVRHGAQNKSRRRAARRLIFNKKCIDWKNSPARRKRTRLFYFFGYSFHFSPYY